MPTESWSPSPCAPRNDDNERAHYDAQAHVFPPISVLKASLGRPVRILVARYRFTAIATRARCGMTHDYSARAERLIS